MVRSLARHWKWITAWVLSLVAVGGLTAAAQNDRLAAGQRDRLTITPQFVSGDDLGFRIERTVEGIPIGKLVIRVDGRWVEVAPPSASGSGTR
jgi:hypothetical protein